MAKLLIGQSWSGTVKTWCSRDFVAIQKASLFAEKERRASESSLLKRAFKYFSRFVKSVVRNTVCAFVDRLSYLLLFQVGSLQNLLRFWTKEVKR